MFAHAFIQFIFIYHDIYCNFTNWIYYFVSEQLEDQKATTTIRSTCPNQFRKQYLAGGCSLKLNLAGVLSTMAVFDWYV